ncbi:MAG: hypothetical protein R3335_15700 [Anaerolineales bacterium]|nr:hypothetical protein [Anaerolineales bacterium]
MFRCKQDGEIFYSIVDCEQHIAREHPDLGETPCIPLEYRCSYCGMAFPHHTDVRNHALRDHGIQRIEVQEVALA